MTVMVEVQSVYECEILLVQEHADPPVVLGFSLMG